MFLTWLRNRRRRKLLAEPFPADWQDILRRNVVIYRRLPETLAGRLRDVLRIIVSEKDWEGCRGLAMSAEIQVTIAAQVALMTLGQDDFYFDNVRTILVYPSGYRARRRHGLSGEAFIVGDEELLGEADYNGPIILSWDEVLAAGREPGHGENLIFHEFAHKIDMLNGDADGTPPMPWALRGRWQQIVPAEYQTLVHAAEWRRDSFLDPYGATNEAEFFAVVTEAFFDDPLGLRKHHRDLYDLFRELYRLEPAEWFAK